MNQAAVVASSTTTRAWGGITVELAARMNALTMPFVKAG